MKTKFLIIILLALSVNTLFAQRDKDEGDPMFKSAYTKYENKDYTGAYLDYTTFLMKKPKPFLTTCLH